jgi:predicted phosphodiesterase
MVNGYNLGAVLHGHTHHNEIYNIGGIRFCNAGSSIMNQNGICQYNVLTVANNKAEISQKIHYANTAGSLISFWSPKTVGLAAQSTGT